MTPPSEPRPSSSPSPPRPPSPSPSRARSRTLALHPAIDADGPFAASWWGDAWVRALEDSALDQARLARGRTYARGGHVGPLTVTPGRITAAVHGSRSRPYRAELRLAVLSEEQWDGLLDAIAARPEHVAALLEKTMPRALAETARTAGVPLLPGPGEPAPHCSCPDRGHPCKHAAALCYQAARFLDADPFVLLLTRGRGEDELLEALARRTAAHEAASALAEAAAPLPGVNAAEALAMPVRAPLPPPLPPPRTPGAAPLLPGAVGPGTGPAASASGTGTGGIPDPTALDFLATDASARAHAALTDGARNPFPALTPWHDAVRLAATHPHLTGRRTLSPLFARLAGAAGRTAQDLARAAAAWRQGGETGLAVLEAPWDPPAGNFDRARSALRAAGLPRMTISRNHLTDPARTLQLRYGPDTRWYPYRSAPGADDWWPEGPADEDPVGALTELLEE